MSVGVPPPLTCLDVVETTVLGTAGLAGLAAGARKSPDEFLAGRRFTRFAPGREALARRACTAEWQRAIDTALHWAAADWGKRRQR